MQDPKGNLRLTTGRDHCPETSRTALRKGKLLPEHNNTGPVDARYPPDQLLPCRQRLRGKICGRGERTTSIRHSAKILQMLMRLEQGAVLQTYHQMGLCRTKSSPLHARVCPQSPHPLPTPSPGKATGSTLPPRQTKLWGKNAILTRGQQLTSAQQGGEKNHPRGVRSIPVPCKGGQWGTTPGPQLSCVPTGKPNGENNGSLQEVFGLHDNTGRSHTHLPSK